ncbi:hypothetical protein C8R46DRAFT_1139508 [Mycena filopes]|nr:hypothetical protein C8R46DRAFT_1139508 [Mycena filopes]
MSTDPQSLILSIFPPEITAKVFGHCLRLKNEHRKLPVDGHPALQRWSPSPREAPLLLAQICRQWRDICLDTPNLWTSIEFDDTQPIEFLLTWLSRAGNSVPLSLRIRASGATASLVMDIILPYSHRWQHIHLALSAAEPPLLHMHHFPILEQLTLAVLGTQSHSTDPIIIQSAPLLAYTDIRTVPNLEFAADVCMHHLTTLRLHSFTLLQTFAILRTCPSILDLSCNFRWLNSRRLPPMLLPSLRALTVTDDQMLPVLTTPNLEQLSLQYTSHDTGVHHEAVREWLERSHCDLLSLSLNTRNMRSGHLQYILGPAHMIRHLRVTVANSMDFPYLMRRLHSPTLLPNLVHLEVHDPSEMIASTMGQYQAMLHILPRRHKQMGFMRMELFLGRHTVDRVHILPVAVMQRLCALAEKGLQVRVTAQARQGLYHEVTFLDTCEGSLVEYTDIPDFDD